MNWFTILKVDDRYKERIGRFGNRAKRSGEIGRGKDTSSKAGICDLCGKKKSARNIMRYGPHLNLCRQCAYAKYGKDWKDKGKRFD